MLRVDLERALESRDGEAMLLMPRALLLTALVRLGMCDLFIHGTGGLIYDRVTEQWFADWLGQAEGSIAPMIGVTAAVVAKKPGEVPRSQGKAVRVRDLRPKGG